MKKFFTFLLALTAGAGTLFAESGKSGSLDWDLTDGVLTISGTGAMNDFNTYSSIAPWLSFKESITSVVIQEGVTSIGEYAFNECAAMTSIEIPGSVTSIGVRACNKCTALNAVTIPESVTSIGNYVFAGCTALTAIEVASDNPDYCSEDGVLFNKDKTTLIQYPAGNARTEYTIPDGVTSFGEAFLDCSLTALTIPGSVTRIGLSAFYENNTLTSVTIGEGVPTIGNYAFYHCTALTSITIPNSVTSIGQYAFDGCTALTSAVIGDGVTELGSSAFANCTALTAITIGKSLTKINGNIYCNNITSVIWNAKNCENINWGVNPKVESFTFGDEVESIPSQCCQYMKLLSTVTIPNSVTSIGSNAFSNCEGLTTVTLGNSVTTIGAGAFNCCSALKSINIPNSVTSIGSQAFNVCSSLTSIVIPNGVTSIERNTFRNCENLTSVTLPNSVTSIGEGAFNGCYALSSITIPAGVTSIGKQAFYNCIALTSVTIPDGVTSIETETFAGCESLTSIKIGKNVTSIGAKAFAGCDGIASFDVAAENQTYCTVDGVLFNKEKTILIQYPAGKQGAYTIPDGVTDFGQAFYYCSGLTSLTIPEGITSIESTAFVYCTAMTSISIPNSVTSIGESAFAASGLETISIPEGVTSLGENVFYYCQGLTSATIGDGLTSIPNSTFWGCSALETVTIGKSVTSFGQNVFKECSNLKSIIWNAKNGTYYDFGSQIESFTFGEEVETIPYKCCYSMSGLKSVTIPNSVTSIGGSAFQFCSGLTEVTIGNNVTNIYDLAFYYCTGLKTLTCNAATPPTCDADVFTGVNSENVVLNVPDESITAYSNTEPWSMFKLSTPSGTCGDNVTWELNTEGVLTISGTGDMGWEVEAPWAAYYADVKTVVIEEGVTDIGAYAFAGFEALTKVTIPNTVTNIEIYAFDHCSGLTTVTIPESVTELGGYAFGYCTGLTTIFCFPVTPLKVGKAFVGVDESAVTVYVSDDSFDAYKAHEEWSKFNLVPLSKSLIASGTLVNNDQITWRLSYYGELIVEGTGAVVPDDDMFFSYPWDEYRHDIKSLMVGEGITALGNEAFGWFDNMESVSLPNSLTFISAGALNGAHKLTSIAIPNNVTTIGDKALSNCYELTTIILGSGLQEISANALGHSLNAQSVVTCYAVTPPTCREGVFGSHDNVPLYVPAESVDAYKAAEVWKKFDVQPIDEETEPTVIASGTCGDEGDNLIWELTTNGVLTISGEGAMSNWINPAYFASPRRRAQLAEATFAPWYQYRAFIQHVVIEAGITSIGNSAFYGCSNVQSITCLAATPPTCGTEAFEGIDTSIPLYVPETATDAYESASTWKDFTVQASEKTPTAVETVTDKNSAGTHKVLREGQIYILRDGKTYTLTGQEVK